MIPACLKTDQTTRRAFDLIAEGFGPGFNGPLTLVSTDPAMTPALAQEVDAALKADPGIAFASPGSPMVDSTGQPVSPPDVAVVGLPEDRGAGSGDA